jgi:hypothetical protein
MHLQNIWCSRKMFELGLERLIDAQDSVKCLSCRARCEVGLLVFSASLASSVYHCFESRQYQGKLFRSRQTKPRLIYHQLNSNFIKRAIAPSGRHSCSAGCKPGATMRAHLARHRKLLSIFSCSGAQQMHFNPANPRATEPFIK